MLRSESKQLNFYSILYQNIPENHILKTINSAITFEFINKLLEDSYCKDFGRPAKEPEMMTRILLLQEMYGLSDERVLEETQVNLAYMWFIGINPDDPLPHPSLLSKFRTMRLKGTKLDDIMTEIVRQCIEKGIIKAENGTSIDTTHIMANTTKKVPERIMKRLAKKIFKAMERTDYEIPEYKRIEDHKEAKRVMKEYLENTIEEADERAKEEVELAREIIESPLFMEQKGIRSITDTDARVGYKTKTDKFFGYKMEYALTTDGQLITAVGVHNGAYVDGTDFEKLYERSKQSGLNIKTVYGDKAYFRKDILDTLKEDKAKAYIPVNACSYRIDEELYSYNKDSDQWVCKRGNRTISKKTRKAKRKDRGESLYYEYVFDKEDCEGCPLRDECIKTTKTKAKKLMVGTSAGDYYEHSQWAKTEEFAEEYRKRASIEWKNAELKRFHGLARAKGYGLRSVATQAKLAALAVNLKRIARLLSPKEPNILAVLTNIMNSFCHVEISVELVTLGRA
jgi:transposase